MPIVPLFSSVTSPSIRTRRDVARYAICVSMLATSAALAIDIVNQMIFFIDWSVALRSWIVTVLVASAIAAPIGLLAGRAQRALHVANDILGALSRTDPLTGLPNRRALMEAAHAAADGLILAIVDIDRFKNVNDTHGHRVGDVVICAVGHILATHLGAYGEVGRLGGEEFALVSPGFRPGDIAKALASLQATLAQTPIIENGAHVRVTISAGLAALAPGESFDHCYSDADAALYAAKRAGRNRIELAPRLAEGCGMPAPPRPALDAIA